MRRPPQFLEGALPVSLGGTRCVAPVAVIPPGVKGDVRGRWASWCCQPRTAAAGGRPKAGLEFVEKLLTTNLTSTDTRSGTLRAGRSASRSSHRWSSWLLVLAPRRPGRRRRRPPKAWPQLLGQHFDHRSGAAVLGG